MKRLIKASNALSQMREAQRQLAFLSKEKVDYVRKCYNDVLAEYSKVDPEHPYPSYMYDDMADFLENVGYEQEHDYSNHNIDLFVRDSSSSKERSIYIGLNPINYPAAVILNPKESDASPYNLMQVAIRMRPDVIAVDTSMFYDESFDAINENAIKTDWLMGALEDDLMTEEEFNHIYKLIDTASMEDAIAHS